jgi:predicted HicB family RNase H-like nuclease
MSAMVRIRDEDHEMLKELAERAGMSISEVVSRALEAGAFSRAGRGG